MSATAVIARALQSGGESNDAIYRAAARALRRIECADASRRAGAASLLVDAGCGTGRFREFAGGLATEYVGVDVVRHGKCREDLRCLQADLDGHPIPLSDGCAAIVTAIEVIEHLDNPRAFCRELVRILAPGGCLLVTTPNQASALSVLSLATRGRFPAFHETSYPVHRTALLPVDLQRIALECGLRDVEIHYSLQGRIPLTPIHYPRFLSRALPRALSDNVLMLGRKDG
jgi:SAM-dependent methyltransferase